MSIMKFTYLRSHLYDFFEDVERTVDSDEPERRHRQECELVASLLVTVEIFGRCCSVLPLLTRVVVLGTTSRVVRGGKPWVTWHHMIQMIWSVKVSF